MSPDGASLDSKNQYLTQQSSIQALENLDKITEMESSHLGGKNQELDINDRIKELNMRQSR